MNYLASPPLVVAYALRGDVDADLSVEPLGTDKEGKPVYLKDIWPTAEETNAAMRTGVRPDQFTEQYARVFDGDEEWQKLETPTGQTFAWSDKSTYVKKPPFFETALASGAVPSRGARVLALLATREHRPHAPGRSSPNIPAESPSAGLQAADATPPAHAAASRVMMSGTFANIESNLMLDGMRAG